MCVCVGLWWRAPPQKKKVKGNPWPSSKLRQRRSAPAVKAVWRSVLLVPLLVHALGHHRHVLKCTVTPRFLRRLCVVVHMDVLAPFVLGLCEVAFFVVERKNPVDILSPVLPCFCREVVRQVLPHTSLLQLQLPPMFVEKLVVVKDAPWHGPVLPASAEIIPSFAKARY